MENETEFDSCMIYSTTIPFKNETRFNRENWLIHCVPGCAVSQKMLELFDGVLIPDYYGKLIEAARNLNLLNAIELEPFENAYKTSIDIKNEFFIKNNQKSCIQTWHNDQGLCNIVLNKLPVSKFEDYLTSFKFLFMLAVNIIEKGLASTETKLFATVIVCINRHSENFKNVKNDLEYLKLRVHRAEEKCLRINGIVVDKGTEDTWCKLSISLKSLEYVHMNEEVLNVAEPIRYIEDINRIKKPSGIYQIERDRFFGFSFQYDKSMHIVDNNKKIHSDREKLFEDLKILKRAEFNSLNEVFVTWTYSIANSEYSIEEFILGNKEIPDVSRDVINYLRLAIQTNESESYFISILTTWIVSTYCFEIFDEHPMLILLGDSDANIQTIIRVVISLAYNGKIIENARESRILENATKYQPTLGIVDLDRKDMLEKRSSVIYNCLRGNIKIATGNDGTSTFYCPKIMHSPDFLLRQYDHGEHTIPLQISQMNERYKRNLTDPERQKISDKIFFLVMKSIDEIKSNYLDEEYFHKNKIKKRLWKSLFAVARVIGTDKILLEYHSKLLNDIDLVIEKYDDIQLLIVLFALIKKKGSGYYFYRRIESRFNDRLSGNRIITKSPVNAPHLIKSILDGWAYPEAVDKMFISEAKQKGIDKDSKERKKFAARSRYDNTSRSVNPDTVYYLDLDLLKESVSFVEDKYSLWHLKLWDVINEEAEANYNSYPDEPLEIL